MSVALVYDSTADLPDGPREHANWAMVPLFVSFGAETFADYVELSSAEFYARLRSSDELPKTAAPAPGSFAEAYERLLADHEHVISLHISGKLSGTVGAARIGAEAFPGRVTVIDSEVVSVRLGLLVTCTQEVLDAGGGLDGALAYIEQVRGRGGCVFTVDTLEYLQKGGRIGRAQALVGSLLNVKPVLAIEDGEAAPIGRARGRRKALDALVDEFDRRAPVDLPLRLAVVHGEAEDDARAVGERACALRAQARLDAVASFGAVIGTYAGPGTVGLGWIPAPGGA